ncbi:hypothetical protein JYU20_00985 [Bacteroidales bacterium AH-315-I05]|nr:hypothetical protein [Bacteroidales bacterium AH-315-I05]
MKTIRITLCQMLNEVTLKFKISIFALLYAAFILTSCGGETHDHSDGTHEHGEGHKHEHDHEHGDDDHAHIYTCPMKCAGSESDKPGKCPVCGMELEHSDKALDESSYHIDFHSHPQQFAAGGSAELSFTPKKEGDESALVPLDIHHEKKIHLMILSTDLSYFEHIHPQYNGQEYLIKVIGKDESFTKERGLNETEFTEGGDYIMYLDYVPAGAAGHLDKIPLTVSGPERTNTPLGNQRLVWENDEYQVELSADKDLTVNTSIQLKIHITKDGKGVTDLDKYLGALAHMVVLSEDTEEYLHVHPMESATNGPDVMLNTNFPKAGKYKVFMQFNHNGKVRTTDFVVEVK